MLEPREADVPVLFLVLVVLPLIAYVLLGKWSEVAKKRESISFLAQLAAEEALRVETITTVSVNPLVPASINESHLSTSKNKFPTSNNEFPVSSSKNGFHVCARCFALATTRCSRCKSVRYCSGKCQIIHWRQVHKQECHQLEKTSSSSSSLAGSIDDSINERLNLQLSGYNNMQAGTEKAPPDGLIHPSVGRGASASKDCSTVENYQTSMLERTADKWVYHKSNKELLRREDATVIDYHDEISRSCTSDATSSSNFSSKEASIRHKMLFPYEEFLKLFQYEVFDLSPRGLLNCGNSCYANAVLQCLTWTKPLVIYLLRRSHSSACCRKDWCLMCELEQHVMMLREIGGPLSPGRILSHMRSISCQIGDGSQEDAHEFLRLLVASMQSICLERLGGESKVDTRLQETTFIQYTFGGRLWSKVKCLICYHESERYENIMDLTLEIFGWVESLEDALTQFTSPEDLDGENMYKCARCAAYVRARKQLRIHEAPNVLTIVLKRFQEGRYGKINKCITFPELLDMIPFMTGSGDTPPLYMLYAVVVHLDTRNASFSGHYVSYIKDMQGTWFRIDDTEVHPVPMSQVMSEGAYILFYMRSCPCPQRALSGKAMRQQVPASARHSESQKPSRQGQSNSSSHFVGLESFSVTRPEDINGFTDNTSNSILRRGGHKNMLPVMENYDESPSTEFSDVTSSDWSLFTSSDEASFTTESARDSFSTVDYADGCNVDPFYNLYGPESASPRTVCCRTFSSSKLQTRFLSEKGYVLNLSMQCLNRARREENLRQVSDSSTELSSDSNCDVFVNYGSNHTYIYS